VNDGDSDDWGVGKFGNAHEAIQAHQRGSWVAANLSHLNYVEHEQLACLRASDGNTLADCISKRYIDPSLSESQAALYAHLSLGSELSGYKCPAEHVKKDHFNDEWVLNNGDESSFNFSWIPKLMRNKVLLIFGEVSAVLSPAELHFISSSLRYLSAACCLLPVYRGTTGGILIQGACTRGDFSQRKE
jgi:hypothetical protein